MANASKSPVARPEPHLRAGPLTLRPLAWPDIPFLIRLMRHPEVRRYLGGPTSWRGMPRALSRHLHPSARGCLWCVCEKRRRLGLVYLAPARDGHSLELSFQFAPNAWGRNAAYTASTAVLSNAAGHDFIAETQSANARARHLLTRLGFVETGEITRHGAQQTLYRFSRSH